MQNKLNLIILCLSIHSFKAMASEKRVEIVKDDNEDFQDFDLECPKEKYSDLTELMLKIKHIEIPYLSNYLTGSHAPSEISLLTKQEKEKVIFFGKMIQDSKLKIAQEQNCFKKNQLLYEDMESFIMMSSNIEPSIKSLIDQKISKHCNDQSNDISLLMYAEHQKRS